MDGRRAEYTDRPLTEIEKAFASNEKNHNELFHYMRMHNLDPEEWYDNLIIAYLNAVKKYCSYERLQVYPFEAILYRTLDNCRSNYYKALHRNKRVPIDVTMSLEYEISNNGHKVLTVADVVADSRLNIEASTIDNECIADILKSLNELQNKMFGMLVDGYSHSEIRKELGVDKNAFANELKRLRKTVKKVLNNY